MEKNFQAIDNQIIASENNYINLLKIPHIKTITTSQ